MNTAAVPLPRQDDSAENGADIIPIESARQKTGSVLGESPDISPDKIQDLLSAVITLNEITRDEYKEYCAHAAEIMNQYVKQGLLAKNEKGLYQASQGHEDDGEELITTFVTILGELKKRKAKAVPQQPAPVDKAEPEKKSEAPKKKPDHARKPELRKPESAPEKGGSVHPLAIEIDNKTFDTPGEAVLYSNQLGKGTDDFRKRYYALLEERMTAIKSSISDAIAKIEKTERIVTKGDQIGIVEIMEFFMERDIFIRDVEYFPNPDVDDSAKKALRDPVIKLAEVANKKIRAIEEGIKQREAAYREILQSENGFEQIVDLRGKTVAQFAYQMHLETRAQQTIIVVDKVAVKFGSVALREGNEFVYSDPSIPRHLKFLNAAAYQLMQKRGKK